MNPVALLDRDGVINHDIGFLWKPEDFLWVSGAPLAIRLLRDKGWKVAVVTNQSGIARGYYHETDVARLHEWMNRQLEEWDTRIDAFYYCPHYPGGTVSEFAIECECRKPRAGMLNQALQDLSADKARSFLIGDKNSDLQAAHAAGVKAWLFTGGDLQQFVREILEKEGWGRPMATKSDG